MYIKAPSAQRQRANCIYDILVRLEYDEAKSARNLRERGIAFDRFVDLDTESSITVEDRRRDYGEIRLRVMGLIDGRVHVAVVTMRDSVVSVISLRRANSREVRFYAKERESA